MTEIVMMLRENACECERRNAWREVRKWAGAAFVVGAILGWLWAVLG